MMIRAAQTERRKRAERIEEVDMMHMRLLHVRHVGFLSALVKCEQSNADAKYWKQFGEQMERVPTVKEKWTQIGE